MRDQRSIKQGAIDKHPFKSTRWKEAKDQLKIESRDKCAYCEAPTSLVAHGDVEHYRPKSIYWWLAYNYDNYLVSCQLCNQTFKSNNFPVRNSRISGPVIRGNTTDLFIQQRVGRLGPDPLDPNDVQQFVALHAAERPLLLNPYFDNPTAVYAWEVDHDINPGEVFLIPHPNDPNSAEFVDAAIQFYGMNRLELKQARYQFYFLYMNFRIIRDDPANPAATRQRSGDAINTMTGDRAAFSGMILYFESLGEIPLPS